MGERTEHLRNRQKVLPAVGVLAVLLVASFCASAESAPKVLSGFVYDHELQPVGNATLSLRNLNSGWVGTARADASGHFEVVLTNWSEGNVVSIIVENTTIRKDVVLDGSFFQVVELWPGQQAVTPPPPTGDGTTAPAIVVAALLAVLAVLAIRRRKE